MYFQYSSTILHFSKQSAKDNYRSYIAMECVTYSVALGKRPIKSQQNVPSEAMINFFAIFLSFKNALIAQRVAIL